MLPQCPDASRPKDKTAKSPWPVLESSHPLMKAHTHAYIYVYNIYVCIHLITLGEAALLAIKAMGAQAQMHT